MNNLNTGVYRNVHGRYDTTSFALLGRSDNRTVSASTIRVHVTSGMTATLGSETGYEMLDYSAYTHG
jgi:hypothetical protein